jgi:phthalate 4,5-dioxygenase
MLTREENELLCRVGPATPMGKMLRRYWVPAALSTELEAGGAPKRLRLLGEDFVAFRGSDGRVGVLDENCPHRGASLVLARNEDCALRCLYHGWKIAPDGRILETPPEPAELGFADKIRAVAYPTYEAGGFIWTYLGPAGTEPPRMDFDWVNAPDSERIILKAREECNWAQCLEGVIDSAHSNYLHSGSIVPGGNAVTVARADQMILDRPSNDGAPKIEVQNTSYGFRYAAIRKPLIDADKQSYIRVTLFAAPYISMFPGAKGWINAQIFFPIDDTHTMFHYIQVREGEPLDDETRANIQKRSGMRPGIDLDDDFRKIRTRENTWMQDREAMKNGSFSGIGGVNNEDIAVQESMGAIYDRTKEHLGTSDVAVIRMRRLMIDAARAHAERGEPPLGLAEPVPYHRVRAEERMIPLGSSWQTGGAFAGEPIGAA